MDATPLLQRRAAALDRLDAADARWPDRDGAAYRAEMGEVCQALREVAQALDAAHADALERSRSWRYLGDALFDLARGTDAAVLRQGEAAYASAEALMTGLNAPLDRAKLDFNFANTLRGLAAGRDRALLEEADLRYHLAETGFAAEAPQHLPQVQRTRASLQPQLKLLGVFEQAGQALGQLQALQADLAAADDDPHTLARVRQALAAQRQGPAQLLAQAQDAVADAAAQGPAGAAQAVAAMVDQLAQAQQAAGQADDPAQRLLPLLLAQFADEVAAGRISPERAGALRPLLAELQAAVNMPAQDLSAKLAQVAHVRGLMRRLSGLLPTPSRGGLALAPGSRAEAVDRMAGRLAQHLAELQALPGLQTAEREAGTALFNRLGQTRSAWVDAQSDDARATTVEHDQLRPLALEIQQFGGRGHLMLARPFWAVPVSWPDANGVYLWGAAARSPAWAALLAQRRLRAITPAADTEAGQAAWQALWACAAAVFDLRGLAPEALAAACYEIGLARCLGRRLVVLTAPAQVLPFDIELAPLALADDNAPASAAPLSDALDQALYAPPAPEGDGVVAATVAALRAEAGEAPPFAVRHGLKLLDERMAESDTDPVLARRGIEAVLGFMGSSAPTLLQPAWPGRYPAPGVRRLFHVMPFGPAWADAVRDQVAQACAAAGVAYLRGDDLPDARVIRSIWHEIGAASHVLVDLTGFNPNVALELGLAHGLGRPCLVVAQAGAQADTVNRLLPTLRRVRVLPYGVDGPASGAAAGPNRQGQRLADRVAAFLDAPQAG